MKLNQKILRLCCLNVTATFRTFKRARKTYSQRYNARFLGGNILLLNLSCVPDLHDDIPHHQERGHAVQSVQV
jgi:hypothetical protein